MKTIYALTKRELGSLFFSPALHVVAAIFVFLYGIMFALQISTPKAQATSADMCILVCFISILLIPLITMRSLAEESSSGTIELLLTAPVSAFQVVVSKFLGAFLFYAAALLPLLVNVLILRAFGQLDVGQTCANLLGVVLIGITLTSIGLFISAMTSSQIVSAAGAMLANLLLVFLKVFAEDEFRDHLLGWLANLSFWHHYSSSFSQGIVNSQGLVYFVTMPAAMLFLTWLTLHSRGVFASTASATRRIFSALSLLTLIASAVLLLSSLCWAHLLGYNPLEWFSALQMLGLSGFTGPLLLLAGAFGALLLSGYLFHLSRSGHQESVWQQLRQGDGVPTLIGGLAVLVLFVNVNYLATYPFDTFQGPLSTLSVLRPRFADWSDEKKNSLSLPSQKTLDELNDRFQITVFFSAHLDEYRGVNLLEDTRYLLKKYTDYSTQVQVEYIDAHRQRARALHYAKAFGLAPQQLHHVSMFQYRGRSTIVPSHALMKPPGEVEALRGKKDYTFKGEQTVTTAIKRLMDPRRTRVYFAAGHGEYQMRSKKKESFQVGLFVEALQRENFVVKRLLFRGEPIPADCDVLALVGPRVPYGELALRSIEQYVARGGRLLVTLPAIDPRKQGVPLDQDIYRLLRSWGAAPQGDSLLDPRNRYNNQSTHVYVGASQSHVISAEGRAATCVFPISQSLEENPEVHEQGWQMERLLITAKTAVSHRKSESETVRRNGPFTVAVTSAKRFKGARQQSRVTVVANTEWLSNLSLGMAHNKPMSVAMMHWLAGRHYDLPIPEADYLDRSLKITQTQQRLIGWVSAIWLPMVWLLLALGVWWMRKA